MQKPGEAGLPRLFEKIKVGRYELKNRVKYAAC